MQGIYGLFRDYEGQEMTHIEIEFLIFIASILLALFIGYRVGNDRR